MWLFLFSTCPGRMFANAWHHGVLKYFLAKLVSTVFQTQENDGANEMFSETYALSEYSSCKIIFAIHSFKHLI